MDKDVGTLGLGGVRSYRWHGSLDLYERSANFFVTCSIILVHGGLVWACLGNFIGEGEKAQFEGSLGEGSLQCRELYSL